eukprot:COSAG06_NODE_43_length_29826_cov_32.009621_17_plen_435_part_00
MVYIKTGSGQTQRNSQEEMALHHTGISQVYGTKDCLRPVAWGSTMGNLPPAHMPGPTGQGSPVPDPEQCKALADGLYDWVAAFAALGDDLRSCGAANAGAITFPVSIFRVCPEPVLANHIVLRVDEISPKTAVVLAGVLERHQYWSDQFVAMRGMAAVDCAWANTRQVLAVLRQLLVRATAQQQHQEAEAKVQLHAYTQEVALPIYSALVTAVGALFTSLLEGTTNVGEMGVVGDLMDSKVPVILNHTDRQLLASALELTSTMSNTSSSTDGDGDAAVHVSMPALPTGYEGRARLFAPTLQPFVDSWPLRIRTVLLCNETTTTTLTAAAAPNATTVKIQWRELQAAGASPASQSPWNVATMRPLRVMSGAGGVFEGEVGSDNTSSDAASAVQMLEWTLSCTCGGSDLVFPASAPQSGQSVVLRPPSSESKSDFK